MSNRMLVGCSILILILTTGAAMAELFGKSSLSPEWAERFKDLSKLNAYAANQPVHLSNVTLTGWDISGAKLPGGRFEDTEWKDVKLERGVLSNVTFKKSKLQGVEFDHGVLTDVTFEDTELRSTSFYKAKLQRVRFIRCKFNGVNVDETVGSTIEIIDSKILNSSLSEGQLVATVKNSTLKDVEFTDLEEPSSLIFEKSELKEVNFSRAQLDTFSLLQVTGEKCGFQSGKVAKVEISESAIGFGMSEVEIGKARIHASKIRSRFSMSKIGEMKVSDCREVTDFGFYESSIGTLEIARCNLTNFRLPNALIENLSITDSSLSGNDFEELKAKAVTLEKVTLGGKVDFSKANVGQLTAKNITKLPGLNLITTGSNVTF